MLFGGGSTPATVAGVLPDGVVGARVVVREQTYQATSAKNVFFFETPAGTPFNEVTSVTFEYYDGSVSSRLLGLAP